MPDKKINSIEQQNTVETSKESQDHSEALNKVDSSGDVADLLEGVAMGEISEKASSQKENKGDAKPGQAVATTQQKQEDTKPKARPLPSINVMRRKVLESMKKEESVLVDELGGLEKNPYAYAEKVKQLRSLRQKISAFLSNALEAVKDVYLKLFGKKHGIENNE